MNGSVVLMRESLSERGEHLAALASFRRVVNYRTEVPEGALVVGRYSVLPFYEELESELANRGARLVNSHRMHRFVADMVGWSGDGGMPGVLDGLTPRTWTTWGNLPERSFYVVKGRTNSRKHRWDTHMFAPGNWAVPIVAQRLLDDVLLQEQGIVVREYVPLHKLGEGLNGLPIVDEWRTFWLRTREGTKLLSSGFYWNASHPELASAANLDVEGLDLAQKAADLVSEHVTFFVLDVARRADGGWLVVEVNDGQMSGLCGCAPEELYSNLRAEIPDVYWEGP